MKVNFGKLKTVALVCLVLMSNFHKINGDDDGEKIKNPRIVIVGAGVSGIAAASKLFENGFTNLILLEAENRIGGRIYTAKFGEYYKSNLITNYTILINVCRLWL